jgi:VWFA-related protein
VFVVVEIMTVKDSSLCRPAFGERGLRYQWIACTLAGFLLLLPSSLGAQQPDPSASSVQQASAPPPATFSTNAELVTVPVSVRGKDGQPLAGLQKDNFTVLDDGKPRSIAVFEEVHASAPLQPDKAPDRQTFSNRVLPAGPGETHAVEPLILVIDDVNTPMLSQTRAKKGLIEYLSSHLDASQPTALWIFTSNGIRQVHAFTRDTQSLIDAARRVQSNLAHTDEELTQEDLGLTQDDPQGGVTALRNEARFRQANAIRDTLNAFQQIAHALAGVPGRKSLVWLSSGFPLTLDDPRSFSNMGTDFFREYENTWQLLNRSEIAVYPVNLEALTNKTYGATSRPARPGMPGARNAPGAAAIPDRQEESVDSLRQFAAATGGRPCINNTDISECIAKATADSRDYYQLAFYVPHDDTKPGWHKLTVKLDQPHKELQARAKYYFAPASAPDPHGNEVAIQNALASTIEYSGVAFSVRPDTLLKADDKGKGIGQRVSLALRISIPATSLKTLGPQDNLQFDVLMLPCNSSGTGFEDAALRLHLTLPPQKAADAQKNGIAITQRLVLPVGSSLLKVVALNLQDGSLGSVFVPLLQN